jgi:hypothetical protein
MSADSSQAQAGDPGVHAELATESAGPEAHASGHGHAGEPTEPLGPIDLAAWAYAVGGAVIGLLVVVALFVASS